MAAAQETSTTRRRRRTVTKTDVNPPSAARRSRGVRQSTEALLADLAQRPQQPRVQPFPRRFIASPDGDYARIGEGQR